MTPDSAIQGLAAEIEEARTALLAALEDKPEHVWTAQELRDTVRNGWSSAAVMMALNRLIAEGVATVDTRHRIQLSSA
jgi:hypothetical protein